MNHNHAKNTKIQMPAREVLIADKAYHLLHHLVLKYERVSFAVAFDCSEYLSSDLYGQYQSKSWTWNLQSDFTENDFKLQTVDYKAYEVNIMLGISTSVIKELNLTFKGLIRGNDKWAIHYLEPIHKLSKHSYICLLHFILNQVLMMCRQIDRRMIITFFILFQNVLSPPNMFAFFTYLIECYLIAYKNKFLNKHLIKHFQHKCHGKNLQECDANEDLFILDNRTNCEIVDSKIYTKLKYLE